MVITHSTSFPNLEKEEFIIRKGGKWTIQTGTTSAEIIRGDGETSVSMSPHEAAQWVRLGRLIPVTKDENFLTQLEEHGVKPKIISNLINGGFTSIELVEAASNDDLQEVDGIGPVAVLSIRQAIQSYNGKSNG